MAGLGHTRRDGTSCKCSDFIDVFVNQEDGQAEILDLYGKVVMTVQLKNEVNRIVISDLPNGVYVLRANGETRKFVKQ